MSIDFLSSTISLYAGGSKDIEVLPSQWPYSVFSFKNVHLYANSFIASSIKCSCSPVNSCLHLFATFYWICFSVSSSMDLQSTLLAAMKFIKSSSCMDALYVEGLRLSFSCLEFSSICFSCSFVKHSNSVN